MIGTKGGNWSCFVLDVPSFYPLVSGALGATLVSFLGQNHCCNPILKAMKQRWMMSGSCPILNGITSDISTIVIIVSVSHIQCHYLLVICYIAIENGHRNSGFTH